MMMVVRERFHARSRLQLLWWLMEERRGGGGGGGRRRNEVME